MIDSITGSEQCEAKCCTHFIESNQCTVHTALQVYVSRVFSQSDLTQPAHNSLVRPNDYVTRRVMFSKATPADRRNFYFRVLIDPDLPTPELQVLRGNFVPYLSSSCTRSKFILFRH